VHFQAAAVRLANLRKPLDLCERRPPIGVCLALAIREREVRELVRPCLAAELESPLASEILKRGLDIPTQVLRHAIIQIAKIVLRFSPIVLNSIPGHLGRRVCEARAKRERSASEARAKRERSKENLSTIRLNLIEIFI